MPDESNLADAQGHEVVEAIRGLVKENFGPAKELLTANKPFHLYHALALSAAMVQWASHETGRTVDEIVDELAANYDH